jgi:hypothetical protein
VNNSDSKSLNRQNLICKARQEKSNIKMDLKSLNRDLDSIQQLINNLNSFNKCIETFITTQEADEKLEWFSTMELTLRLLMSYRDVSVEGNIMEVISLFLKSINGEIE